MNLIDSGRYVGGGTASFTKASRAPAQFLPANPLKNNKIPPILPSHAGPVVLECPKSIRHILKFTRKELDNMVQGIIIMVAGRTDSALLGGTRSFGISIDGFT